MLLQYCVAIVLVIWAAIGMLSIDCLHCTGHICRSRHRQTIQYPALQYNCLHTHSTEISHLETETCRTYFTQPTVNHLILQSVTKLNTSISNNHSEISIHCQSSLGLSYCCQLHDLTPKSVSMQFQALDRNGRISLQFLQVHKPNPLLSIQLPRAPSTTSLPSMCPLRCV